MPAAEGFAINRFGAGGIALLFIALLLVGAHAVVVAVEGPIDKEKSPTGVRRRRGVKALVIGSDGRASTSKLQAVLWTFAVLFAFVFLLVWGRSYKCDDCSDAAKGRLAFEEVVHGELQVEYYVLLGLPFTAALAAKALTTNKVLDGTLAKPAISDDAGDGVVRGLGEVVGNDAGGTDLVDFQYFAFNLLALGYFFFEFLGHPELGLPDMPPTLLALAGVSAGTYTAKKALERQVVPGITSARFVPTGARRVVVLGTGFGPAPAPGEGRGERCVTLDDVTAPWTEWSDRRVVAEVPDGFEATSTSASGKPVAKVVVMDDAGASSAPYEVVVPEEAVVVPEDEEELDVPEDAAPVKKATKATRAAKKTARMPSD